MRILSPDGIIEICGGIGEGGEDQQLHVAWVERVGQFVGDQLLQIGELGVLFCRDCLRLQMQAREPLSILGQILAPSHKVRVAEQHADAPPDAQLLKSGIVIIQIVDHGGGDAVVMRVDASDQRLYDFQLAANRNYTKVANNLRVEGDTVKALFGRLGPNYYCPCPPFIWSAKVWRSLDENYLTPRNLSFWDISTESHPETLLYLEALLNYRAIPLYPIEQLFRIYYYDWQFYLLRRQGEVQKKLANNYLGVIYQSNWESGLDYGSPKKSFLSRANKMIKSFLRYLRSYI